MKNLTNKIYEFIKKYYYLFFCALALIFPNVLLMRLISPGIFSERYVDFARLIFTSGWIFLIVFFCVYVLPKRVGKIIFGTVSTLFIVLSFSEYLYYRIFDQFFWLKSIMLAGEGSDYFSQAIGLIDVQLVLCTVLAIASMVIALVKWKKQSVGKKKTLLIAIIPIAALILTHIFMMPNEHKEKMDQWDVWRKPKVVYKNFSDINKSFEMTGLYQFTYLNLHTALFSKNECDDETREKIDNYFEQKGEMPINEYTGLFKGKNVIAVMMESMDTWLIDEVNTPTLYKMMNEGINFSNYNAPFFGAGFTFGSEFAFNTGYFTPVSAVSASKFSTHTFPYSLARLFTNEGYSANSFHFNSSEFYNRGIMHKSFGYEKYHSLSDFGITGTEAELDSNILKNEELYQKMTEKEPFFNFFITYSAHLPYVGESPKLKLAKEYYPELTDETKNEEKNNIEILAHDTDEFFRQLLERLEADGLLDNTVIIAYTDHFAYGVSNSELIDEWKGDDLSYRVPAFIYAKGIEHKDINKPMMTIDWTPTVVNLFGLQRDGKYVGNDILNPENKGFVYFETWEWMDDVMHYQHSEEEQSEENKEYIERGNKRVRESIEINDAVILGDYFKKEKKDD